MTSHSVTTKLLYIADYLGKIRHVTNKRSQFGTGDAGWYSQCSTPGKLCLPFRSYYALLQPLNMEQSVDMQQN
jgi:hypothetical protein